MKKVWAVWSICVRRYFFSVYFLLLNLHTYSRKHLQCLKLSIGFRDNVYRVLYLKCLCLCFIRHKLNISRLCVDLKCMRSVTSCQYTYNVPNIGMLSEGICRSTRKTTRVTTASKMATRETEHREIYADDMRCSHILWSNNAYKLFCKTSYYTYKST